MFRHGADSGSVLGYSSSQRGSLIPSTSGSLYGSTGLLRAPFHSKWESGSFLLMFNLFRMALTVKLLSFYHRDLFRDLLLVRMSPMFPYDTILGFGRVHLGPSDADHFKQS